MVRCWCVHPCAPSSTPVSSTPVSSTPASSTPVSSTPASSTPASSTPASSTPAIVGQYLYMYVSHCQYFCVTRISYPKKKRNKVGRDKSDLLNILYNTKISWETQ